MSLLEVENINVFYGDIQILWDISLEISKGEAISVIGANGAGKTTLIKTISGLLRPQSGGIRFKGKDTLRTEPSELVAMGIVQIPERRRLFPDLTVLDNIELGAFSKKARVMKNDNLKQVFEIFPILKERKKQDASTLSGGEQQMLAIARGLMAMPELLMLDEPSLGLSPLITKEIFKVAKQINENGVTTLIVDQNVQNALSIADRGICLESGRISAEGQCSILLEDKQIKKAYLGM